MSSMQHNAETVGLPEPVINWLFSVLQPLSRCLQIYQDPRRTFHDSVVVLSQFKQLRPRTRVFTDSNGISELLLCLYGKLEVSPSLPILIWIPRSYPIEHPLLFIDLELLSDSKPLVGAYVNANGEVSIPLFARWDPEGCNIEQAVRELISLSFTNNFTTPVSSEWNGYSIPKHPQLPLALATPNVPPRPPIPPKPILPMKVKSEESSPVPPKIPIRDKEVIAAHSPPTPPQIPKRPPIKYNTDLLDSEVTLQENPRHKEALDHLQNVLNQMKIMDAHNTKETIEDRILPIKSAIEQFELSYNYEQAALNRTRETIEFTKECLDREISAIQRQTEQVEQYENNVGDNPDPNSIVATENLRINQLYEIAAKDYALSDAIHTIGRLLNSGSIKLDTFVKKTRELAREQFLTRMHMQKIISSLGQD